MVCTLEAQYQNHLSQLKDLSQYRTLAPRESSCIDFTKNDYLGFASDPVIKEQALALVSTFGSTGSRLLSGNHPLYEEFEYRIAQDKKTQSALIFNSGYQANISVLPALMNRQVLGKPSIAFCDRLNHASIYDGIGLSGASLVRYRHNDLNHLEDLLKKHQQDPACKFVFSETLFGMDGDCVDLGALSSLCQRYGALLYLDEAHATGVMGGGGYGLSPQCLQAVVMGTFSKALGSSGAYVGCSSVIQDYLINTCRGFIYSTALSPLSVAAAYVAWKKIPFMEKERDELRHKALQLRQRLKEKGFDTGLSQSHIIPIIIGDNASTLRLAQKLKDKNILVSAIRPPSVAPQSSRLRIILTVKHSGVEIEKLTQALGGI